MMLLIGLAFLLAGCVVAGLIRKASGGTFLPPQGLDGDHHVKDRSGRWWRYNEDGTVEEPFRSKKKR